MEFGYWPERPAGPHTVIERRRRPGAGSLWTEIRKPAEGRFKVASQFGTVHPETFRSVDDALVEAKDPDSWCPESRAHLGGSPVTVTITVQPDGSTRRE